MKRMVRKYRLVNLSLVILSIVFSSASFARSMNGNGAQFGSKPERAPSSDRGDSVKDDERKSEAQERKAEKKRPFYHEGLLNGR